MQFAKDACPVAGFDSHPEGTARCQGRRETPKVHPKKAPVPLRYVVVMTFATICADSGDTASQSIRHICLLKSASYNTQCL
ncbi:hypothetical protein RIEGSTA812A_PEG_734 [invertebrate metagenome]|uniref:Uncharacterized protein n=1 Tax=invertebrate metagenome TaxID=1711999 RepID=A0A484H715_9ZZZZ